MAKMGQMFDGFSIHHVMNVTNVDTMIAYETYIEKLTQTHAGVTMSLSFEFQATLFSFVGLFVFCTK